MARRLNLLVLVNVLAKMSSLDRSFMADPLSYVSFQPVIHDWYNKGRGMYYPVWRIVDIK